MTLMYSPSLIVIENDSSISVDISENPFITSLVYFYLQD
jgi:hypothetical protein